jgi:hypothetical protein
MPVNSTQPLKRLHIKMARTAKALKQWKRTKIGDTALQLAIVKEVILRLETAHEGRTLTPEELYLLRCLKARSVGLTLIEKSKMHQRSRLTNIRLGDANTKFFQLRANARSRKNYIQCLQRGNDILFAQEEKEKEVTQHFRQHLGSTVHRPFAFNWTALGYQHRDLSALETSFTPEEIKSTIDSLPGDKAPGMDGFTGAFFKNCWDIIQHDLTSAIN